MARVMMTDSNNQGVTAVLWWRCQWGVAYARTRKGQAQYCELQTLIGLKTVVRHGGLHPYQVYGGCQENEEGTTQLNGTFRPPYNMVYENVPHATTGQEGGGYGGVPGPQCPKGPRSGLP